MATQLKTNAMVDSDCTEELSIGDQCEVVKRSVDVFVHLHEGLSNAVYGANELLSQSERKSYGSTHSTVHVEPDAELVTMLTDQAKALLNVSTANRWRTGNLGGLLRDSLDEIAHAGASQVSVIEDMDRQITSLEQRLQTLQAKYDEATVATFEEPSDG
jgi:hypothetical protein